MSNFSPVITSDIEHIWNEILPWVNDFCLHSQGSYDALFILNRLTFGQMQLWLVREKNIIQAVILTEIRQTLIKEMVIVVTTGIHMSSWVGHINQLELYARSMECKKITGIARPGWEKTLKPLGYQKMHVQVEKVL